MADRDGGTQGHNRADWKPRRPGTQERCQPRGLQQWTSEPSGWPGGHQQDSEVAVLQPTSEFNEDFLQKQTVIVSGGKAFHCSRPTLPAKEPGLFQSHPQAPLVPMKGPVFLPLPLPPVPY